MTKDYTKTLKLYSKKFRALEAAEIKKDLRHGHKGSIYALAHPHSKNKDYLYRSDKSSNELFKELNESQVAFNNSSTPEERSNFRRRLLQIKGRLLKDAHDSMAGGIKIGNLDATLHGADIYARLGVGDRQSVEQRILSAVEVVYQKAKKNQGSSSQWRRYEAPIKELLKRIESRKGDNKQKTLEQHLQIDVAAIAVGFVLLLSFLSSQAGMTGFAVQETSSVASIGWTSIFFFAFIVLAIAYFFNRN